MDSATEKSPSSSPLRGRRRQILISPKISSPLCKSSVKSIALAGESGIFLRPVPLKSGIFSVWSSLSAKLQKKARRHRLDNLYFRVEGDDTDEKNEDLTQSYDVYRHLLPFKKILGLKDLKQKTVEQFLGVFRKDILTGKDLIPLYTEFIGRYRYECIRNKNQIFDGGTNFLADSEDQTEKIPDFSGTLSRYNVQEFGNFLQNHQIP